MSGMALELESKGIVPHVELDIFVDGKRPPNLSTR